MMYGWYGSGAWIAMALMMVLILGGVITIVVLALRRPPSEGGSPSQQQPPPPPSAVPEAERILSERFARGEIDEVEYKSRLAALRHRE